MTVKIDQQWQQNVEDSSSTGPAKPYQQLDKEIRTVLPTNAAAYYLNRKSQTLRSWACFENGPIRPVRISGRLAWPVSDLKRLINGDTFKETRTDSSSAQHEDGSNQVKKIGGVA